METLQALVRSLSEHGEKPGLLTLRRDGREEWSYAELDRQVRHLSHGLRERGLKKGQRVVLFADNSPPWIVACLATLRTGGVVVPLDAQMGDEALTHAVRTCQPSMAFVSSGKDQRISRAMSGRKPKIWRLDVEEPEDSDSWKSLLSPDDTGSPSETQAGDVSVIFFTSGTTGRPKGVPLTHDNFMFQLNTLKQEPLFRPTDRFLLPLPLHHVYPFVFGLLMPMRLGLPVILPRALTGQALIQALTEGRATTLIGVPRLYAALVEGLEDRMRSQGNLARTLFTQLLEISRWLREKTGRQFGRILLYPWHRHIGPQLRIVASGGAALDPDLARKLEALGWQVAVGYGLTETAPLLTLAPPGHARVGTAGRPLPGVELRLDPAARPEVSPTDAPPPTDEANVTGEVLARGPNVFAGYLDLPEESRKAFTKGWFRTGDLGYLDSEGHLHLEGRASTLIVTPSGKNIQPEEVEEAYEAHPLIGEVGVLTDQDQLVAVVVPAKRPRAEAGGEDTEKKMREAMDRQSQNLPSYQRIARYEVSHQSLARTRLGKIRRQQLQELYEHLRDHDPKKASRPSGPQPVDQMSDEDRALLEHDAAREVWEWLAKRFSDQPLSPDSHLQLDLGLDSMSWLNLTLEISQRTGIDLDEEAIPETETVRDLLQEVAEAGGGKLGTRTGQLLEEPEQALDERQQRWLVPLGLGRRTLALALAAMARLLMKALFRLEASGMDRLPEKGPFVIAPNHLSLLDPFAVGSALSREQLRQTHWAGWTGVAFGNPLVRGLSRLAQIVPVDPKRNVVSSLAFAAAVLRRSRILVWFPEGQRSRDGKLQPFKGGIGILLEHFDVPVVPVAIHGAEKALPVGSRWPKPAKIRVTFGEPVSARELRRQGQGDEARAHIVDGLRQQMQQLLKGHGG